MTLIDQYENLIELEKNIKRHFNSDIVTYLIENIYAPGWCWLTIHSIQAQKHKAVKKLGDMLSIPLSDIVVFGDQLNDVTMLKNAGLGIAVENAVEETKLAADIVIGTNNDDSVVKWIMSILGI